jgi:hypothetical protein
VVVCSPAAATEATAGASTPLFFPFALGVGGVTVVSALGEAGAGTGAGALCCCFCWVGWGSGFFGRKYCSASNITTNTSAKMRKERESCCLPPLCWLGLRISAKETVLALSLMDRTLTDRKLWIGKIGRRRGDEGPACWRRCLSHHGKCIRSQGHVSQDHDSFEA